MPAPPSLFCPHKRLVSVCPVCGAARAGAATPMRAAAQHDVDDTIHAFRAECHRRARDFIAKVHAGEAPEKAYWSVYDPLERRGKVHSEEEDPSTFRGGFYRAMVKLFDVTIDQRKIQGYNGLGDWEEMRDFVFRKLSPDDLAAALRDRRLLVHGGNGAWPRQQIASGLLRSDEVEEAVMLLAFGTGEVPAGPKGRGQPSEAAAGRGRNGGTPDAADDAEVVRRLATVEAMESKTLQLSSKVLHVFAPARWPALTPRTTPEAGDELGFPIPPVESPRDYLAFAEAMREIMRAKGHADLDRTDIVVSDAWETAQAR